MNLIKGRTYKWNEILTGLDAVAGQVFYLLHKRGTRKVVAACLRIDLNPRAPYEIIPENGTYIAPWADDFRDQTNPVPVFVEELDGKRYYRGRFKVVGESTDPKEIRLREKQAKRTDIYKILFLEEAR